jgi:hypothetical protein
VQDTLLAVNRSAQDQDLVTEKKINPTWIRYDQPVHALWNKKKLQTPCIDSLNNKLLFLHHMRMCKEEGTNEFQTLSSQCFET